MPGCGICVKKHPEDLDIYRLPTSLKILKSYSVHTFSLALSLATSCAVELSIPDIIQLFVYCLIHEITPSMSRLAQN